MVTPKIAWLSIADSFKNDGEIWGGLKMESHSFYIILRHKPTEKLTDVVRGKGCERCWLLELTHFISPWRRRRLTPTGQGLSHSGETWGHQVRAQCNWGL